MSQKEQLSHVFDEWISDPLTCFVEIGIAVLRREYIYYLVGSLY